MVVYRHQKRQKMSDPARIDFMYRRPGAKDHENITHVLDEIIVKLKEIETRLKKLEDH